MTSKRPGQATKISRRKKGSSVPGLRARRRRFKTWGEITAYLVRTRRLLDDLPIRTPEGVSPRRFRAFVKRALSALFEAELLAHNRHREDKVRELKRLVSAHKTKGLPLLAANIPEHLRGLGAYA